LAGAAVIQSGKPLPEKSRAVDRVISLFHGRVLSFDTDAAAVYAEAVTRYRNAGRSFEPLYLMIGATARANRMVVATRNDLYLEHLGIETVNPWTA
jgi:hypothetical protein